MITNWQTILSGLATALVGAAMIYFCAVVIPADAIDSSVRSVLMLAGAGAVTAGLGIAAARSNAAGVAAHQESLNKIEDAHGAHIDNQVKIAHLETKVEAVPVIAAQTAQAVVEEKLR